MSPKLRSNATTSHSDARQRRPLAGLWQSLRLQAGRLLAWHPPARWHGLVVCLLDGSPVRLRPLGHIPTRLAPHRNQAKAPPYWCPLRVVVGFGAKTGAALDGTCSSLGRSEQVLAGRIILRRAAGACLHVGDRHFGLFRIVQTARAAGSHVLLRLTESRARKLLGRSLRLGRLTSSGLPPATTRFNPAVLKLPSREDCGWCAAMRQGLCPLTLSFSLSRRHLPSWLAPWGRGAGPASSWGKLLALIGRSLLPRRKKARPAEPRAQRHLRQPYPPLIGSRQKARQQMKTAEKQAAKS